MRNRLPEQAEAACPDLHAPVCTVDPDPTLDNVQFVVENGRFEVVFSRPREPANADRDASLDEQSDVSACRLRVV